MKFAFCLYKYFPYGGLQRDFLRIALACQERGFEIRVYTLSWLGAIPDGFEVVIVPVEAITNHKRYQRFSDWVNADLVNLPVDCVIGINKMPDLDVYYAADTCYQEKARTQRNWFDRLLPRFKHFSAFESAVFSWNSRTEILMISDAQKKFFQKYYSTPERRMHFLPPGINRDRIPPENAASIREEFRKEYEIGDHDYLVLMIGSGFIKKGLDRALIALKSLPPPLLERTMFVVIGEDNPSPFKRKLGLLGLRKHVVILSGREDIPRFLLGADLLIHPALDENAGIVLLEAIVAGLPVLATDVCGYAHYVTEANAGCLVSSPFQQPELNAKLEKMLVSMRSEIWGENGLNFSKYADIYSLPEKACSIIEEVMIKKKGAPTVVRGVLGFCLYKYFPFGGLQRDFLRIAMECHRRGFKIRVYTLSWQGDIPDDFDVVIVPVNAITNHLLYQRFTEWLSVELQRNPVDSLIGFNKMPDLDIYYAADSCYEDKARTQRGALYRAIPRYRHFAEFERAVFSAEAHTEILLISETQKPMFLKYYNTAIDRLHLLPPGISPDRRAPENAEEIAQELRREFNIAPDDFLLLFVGSGFVKKGLDRALLGIASLEKPLLDKVKLIVIGQDNPNPFTKMAKRLGISQRVKIIQGRDDIPRFLLGADSLVHPAYDENTGTILLEAMVAGLPVIATDICGYAHYITEADVGLVVQYPYEQQSFNRSLAELITSDSREQWQKNGLRFGLDADVFSMPQRAADFICGSIG